jgi:hypothetical protein
MIASPLARFQLMVALCVLKVLENCAFTTHQFRSVLRGERLKLRSGYFGANRHSTSRSRSFPVLSGGYGTGFFSSFSR